MHFTHSFAGHGRQKDLMFPWLSLLVRFVVSPPVLVAAAFVAGLFVALVVAFAIFLAGGAVAATACADIPSTVAVIAFIKHSIASLFVGVVVATGS